jgi:hypothetical protein
MLEGRILFEVLTLVSKFNPSWKKNRFVDPSENSAEHLNKKLAVKGGW